MAGAKSWLDRIKNPETALVQKQQGYYNYLERNYGFTNQLNSSREVF